MSDPVIKDLGGGLVLRRGRREDADAVADFMSKNATEPGSSEPSPTIGAWTRDLFADDHPTMRPEYFSVVEDTREGRIASALCLIPQTWAYDGIEFGVGQPEIVNTHPDYRNRGLIREQMDAIHAWSRELGHLMQAIDGIPYFYRQFGYEMGIEMGGRWRGLPLPKASSDSGTPAKFSIRAANAADVPFLNSLHDAARSRSLVSCIWNEQIWDYSLNGRSETSLAAFETCIIEDADKRACGFLIFNRRLWRGGLGLQAFELSEGTPWLEVVPVVLNYLGETGRRLAIQTSGELTRIAFVLGADHPAYGAAKSRLTERIAPDYAWYVRVPDVSAFIRHIAPALIRRLAGSDAAGHTGELLLSFYRSGMKIRFEKGEISGVEDWPMPPENEAKAFFPDLSFLQLLFGYRSLDQLTDWYPDCYTESDEAGVLLRALFPQKPSQIMCLS